MSYVMVDIEADGAEAASTRKNRKRQTDVAETDDADRRDVAFLFIWYRKRGRMSIRLQRLKNHRHVGYVTR